MNTDYSKLSDEELDAMIRGDAPIPDPSQAPPGQGAKVAAQRNAAVQQMDTRLNPQEDTSYGMSGVELGLAGAGADLNEMFQGAREKAKLLFPPEGEEGKKVVEQINSDRAERRAAMDNLYKNPEAVAGRFGGQALMSVAAPARLGAQMALTGGMEFMKPGQQKVTGLGGEFINSALQGGMGAGTMGATGQGLKLLGKGIGAGLGQYTDDGLRALETKDAALRLNLPPTTLGQLYPHSSMATIEKGAPGMGYSERTYNQAKALGKEITSSKAGVDQLGGKYVDDLKGAAQERLRLGSEKYGAVDDYVSANGLQPMNLMYTARTATSTKSPGYEGAAALLGDYGFPITEMAGMRAKDLAGLPVSFVNFHESRIAVNKALARVNNDVAREGSKATKDLRDTQSYLRDLKTALDSDIERWGKQVAGNENATRLFREATDYYRDVVAPTVLDNRIARKVLSKYRGFESPRQALGATQSELGVPMVDLLVPTMGQRGKDVTTVLRNLPDVRKTLLSQDMTVPVPEGGGLLQAGKALAGHPLSGLKTAISHLPGLGALSQSRAAARLSGADNVLEEAAGQGLKLTARGLAPRLAYGLAQYPQDSGMRVARRLGGMK